VHYLTIGIDDYVVIDSGIPALFGYSLEFLKKLKWIAVRTVDIQYVRSLDFL
jgi:hypothetical protein